MTHLEYEIINASVEMEINNCWHIILKNNDYTIGKVLEHILITYGCQFCAFVKKHPHDVDSLIQIVNQFEEDPNVKIKEYMTNAIQEAIQIYNDIIKYNYQEQPMYHYPLNDVEPSQIDIPINTPEYSLDIPINTPGDSLENEFMNDEVVNIVVLKDNAPTDKWNECVIKSFDETTGKYTVEVINKKGETVILDNISKEHLQKIQ